MSEAAGPSRQGICWQCGGVRQPETRLCDRCRSCVQCGAHLPDKARGRTTTLCRKCVDWKKVLPEWLDEQPRGAGELTLWVRWRRERPFCESNRRTFTRELVRHGRSRPLEEWGMFPQGEMTKWSEYAGARFPGEEM